MEMVNYNFLGLFSHTSKLLYHEKTFYPPNFLAHRGSGFLL